MTSGWEKAELNGTVSVVIPNFNCAHWLPQSIASCFAQGDFLHEVVVSDDASTDQSLCVLETLQAEYGERLKVVQNPNKGGNNARNFGLSHATGDFIQWLDADDFLLPGKFQVQLACFCEKVEIVYSDWIERIHDAGGHIVGEAERIMESDESLLLSLAADCWSVPANYLMTRSLAERTVTAGGWMPDRRVAQDREFFTIAAVLAAGTAYVPGLFSIYNRRPSGSVSGMDFGQRLELQMPLDARLRAFVGAAQLEAGEKTICIRRINTHCINAAFYNPRIMPLFFFWPWQISMSLMHWKKCMIYPLLYMVALVGYCRHLFWKSVTLVSSGTHQGDHRL